MKKFSLLTAALLAAASAQEFSELDVSATGQAYEAFATPGASAQKDTSRSDGASIDSALRQMPGVFTSIHPAHGLKANIRSMSGFGRVNTTIDGVKQTNFATDIDSAFHGDVGASGFGSNIDANFIVNASSSSGQFYGANGGGLMGSVQLRTLNASDILLDDKNFGALARYDYGFNAGGTRVMAAAAARAQISDEFAASLMYAYSLAHTKNDYKTGAGHKLSEPQMHEGEEFSAPYEPKDYDAKPHSHLAKLDLSSDVISAQASYRGYSAVQNRRKINDRAYQINFSADAGDDVLNARGMLSYSQNKQKYLEGAEWGYFDASGREIENKAVQFELSNEQNFMLPREHELRLNYGLSLLFNKYDNNQFKPELSDEEAADFMGYIFTGFPPKGEQNIYRFYADATVQKGIVSLNSSLAYHFDSLRAHKDKCAADNIFCSTKEAGELKKKFNNFDYSLIASADVSPYFAPFASYSSTSRSPNLQEYFRTSDTNMNYQNTNEDLKPERANTYQIGFNGLAEGAFASDDVLAYKALYFDTRVKNYIFDRFYDINDDIGTMFLMHDNGLAKVRGVELSAMYDAKYFYANFDYVYQKVNLPFSDSQSHEFGGAYFAQSDYANQPRSVANLTLGARAFEQTLDISASAKFIGGASRMRTSGDIDDDPNNPFAHMMPKHNESMPKIPAIIDLHASYAPVKNLRVFARVENLLNEDYVDALYDFNSTGSQEASNGASVFTNKARGRTFYIGAELRY